MIQELMKLKKELKTLQSKRDSLGLFSFKEKKALDQQINDTQIEILRARTKCDDLQYQIDNQIKELKFKILKINDRLMLHGEKPKL